MRLRAMLLDVTPLRSSPSFGRLWSGQYSLLLALQGLFAPLPAAGVLGLAGAADTVCVVSRGTVVQAHTPGELLGRVSAAEQIVGQAGPDLGNLRAGLVADATS